jgi:hypothetical protein
VDIPWACSYAEAPMMPMSAYSTVEAAVDSHTVLFTV